MKIFQEIDLELPRCFSASCKCGWKGRMAAGAICVMGEFGPLQDCVGLFACPRCDKLSERLIDQESLEQRFKWALENIKGVSQGYSDVFPCTCNPKPSLRLDGEIRFWRSTIADTVFFSDEEWVRILAKVKCNGCYALCEVSLVERHSSNLLWREPWFLEKFSIR